jgi:hypothetical protein
MRSPSRSSRAGVSVERVPFDLEGEMVEAFAPPRDETLDEALGRALSISSSLKSPM